MASPGSFSAGGVLTAAEMNALPAGELGEGEGADVSLTTSLADVTSVTFTLSSSRRILVTAQSNQIDLVSTDLNVLLKVQDTNAAGSPTAEYLQLRAVCINGLAASAYGSQIVTLAAGTHTLYLVAQTSTGTCRLNYIASQGAYNALGVMDVGSA